MVVTILGLQYLQQRTISKPVYPYLFIVKLSMHIRVTSRYNDNDNEAIFFK